MSTSIQFGPIAQLRGDGVQVLRLHVFRAHDARCDRARDEIGAGLDAIRLHLVARGVQFLDTLDHDLVRARALDLRAHRDEELREVDHFRFARGVLDDGFAVGQRRGHHEVLGARDRDGLEIEARTLEPACARADVAAVDLDVRTHGLQARDVDVHRPRADGAAARQRHVRLAETREQRSQHQDGRAHRLDQLVGREALARGRAVDLDLHLLVDGDRDAHAA
jgi:hypothetical protein